MKPKFTRFEDYITQADAEAGEAAGTMVRGRVRINAKNFEQSYIPGGKRFLRDIYVTSLQDRNRALEGDINGRFLKRMRAERAFDIGSPAAPANAPKQVGWPPAPSTPEAEALTVRVIGFPTDTVTSAEVAAFFSESAGLKGLKPTVVPAFKVVDILCPDELTACALAQRTGCSYNGGTVHMTRGDGMLFHVDQVDPLFVQALAKVVFIEPSDKVRHFAGCLQQFAGGGGGSQGGAHVGRDMRRQALFVSKDYRVPRILVPLADCPDDF
eukprot:gene17111-21391_t